MGKHIEAKEVLIRKLEKPVEVRLRNKANEWFTRVYTYRVKLIWDGRSSEFNCENFAEAIERAEKERIVYEPSWEEVTDNGRYSCD